MSRVDGKIHEWEIFLINKTAFQFGVAEKEMLSYNLQISGRDEVVCLSLRCDSD